MVGSAFDQTRGVARPTPLLPPAARAAGSKPRGVRLGLLAKGRPRDTNRSSDGLGLARRRRVTTSEAEAGRATAELRERAGSRRYFRRATDPSAGRAFAN